MCHQLDQTGVDEDTSTDGVEDAVHDEGGLRLGGEGGAYTKTDSNGDGSGETVSKTQEVWRPALGTGPWNLSETSAQTEAFERLVEDEDNVQGDELLTGDGEGETNEDRVEDDTELKDEDGGKLGGVCFGDDALILPVGAKSRVVHMVTLVAEVVFTADVGWSRYGFLCCGTLVLEAVLIAMAVGVAGSKVLRVVVRVVVTAAKLGVTHGH